MLYVASDELRNDKEFVLEYVNEAVKQNEPFNKIWGFLPEKYQEDTDVIMTIKNAINERNEFVDNFLEK